jgi:putative cardiolipin synthase
MRRMFYRFALVAGLVAPLAIAQTDQSEEMEDSKAFIFDRKHIFIGSLNLDPRSIHENTEIGVVLTSPQLAGRITPVIDEALDRIAYRLALETHSDGREQIVWHEPITGDGGRTYSVDPHTGFWNRFLIGFVGLLPVESQL